MAASQVHADSHLRMNAALQMGHLNHSARAGISKGNLPLTPLQQSRSACISCANAASCMAGLHAQHAPSLCVRTPQLMWCSLCLSPTYPKQATAST